MRKIDRVIASALPLLGGSNNRMVAGLTLLKCFARAERHRRQINQLIDWIKMDLPMVNLVRRLFTQTNSTVREKFVTNLAINAIWQGDQSRRDFAAKHDLDIYPVLGVISPLTACNYDCYGCYDGERGDALLPFETVDWVITEGKKMGTYFWVISGGEPFLYPRIMELFRRHQDCAFLVYTNGSLIDDQVADELAKLGNVAPAISVEGFAAETDDRRGSGAFAKVLLAIQKLRERGVVFGFSATATRRNAEIFTQNNDFYEFMVDQGCYFGWFFIFVPVGKDATTELMLTAKQRDALRRKNCEIQTRYPIFVADFWDHGELTEGCMSGGTMYFHINANGDAEPCVFWHKAVHNVKDLQARGGHLWEIFESDFFRQIRQFNRQHINPLMPCPLIDHNGHACRICKQCPNAYDTHPGASEIVGRLAPELQQIAGEYAVLAIQAWETEPRYRQFQ